MAPARPFVVIGTTRVLNLSHWKDLEVPEGAVYVGRRNRRFPKGSRWANRFSIAAHGLEAGPMFARQLLRAAEPDILGVFTSVGVTAIDMEKPLKATLTEELKGRWLMCWCIGSGHRCHAMCLAYGAEGDWAQVKAACDLAWWTKPLEFEWR